MIDSIRWFFSLRRNTDFRMWMRDTHTLHEIKELANEATDSSLINPYDPTKDQTWEQQRREEEVRRKTVRRLINRYGDDIWNICLGIGGYNPDSGNTGLSCLAKLKLSFQVYNTATFEEFLVRNAIKCAAIDILERVK